jgi:hypothetical protein
MIHPMEFQTNTLYLRSEQEHQELQQIREEAFTPWVKPLPYRLLVNLLSRLHADFFLEVREVSTQRLAGCLFSVPAYWSGDPLSLQTYDYSEKALFSRPLQKLSSVFSSWVGDPADANRAFLDGANACVLLALLVFPSFRGMQIPSVLLRDIQTRSERLGFAHVISPFRPSNYGAYKREQQQPHSEELFTRYCNTKDETGQPIDPWLRTLSRNGVSPLKIEMRSVQIERPLYVFESLKKNFRPNDWYKTSLNTWECGETATWYTDPFRQVALSVEPNLWQACCLTHKHTA